MNEVPFDLALVERVQNGIMARIPSAVQTTAVGTSAVKDALGGTDVRRCYGPPQ